MCFLGYLTPHFILIYFIINQKQLYYILSGLFLVALIGLVYEISHKDEK